MKIAGSLAAFGAATFIAGLVAFNGAGNARSDFASTVSAPAGAVVDMVDISLIRPSQDLVNQRASLQLAFTGQCGCDGH